MSNENLAKPLWMLTAGEFIEAMKDSIGSTDIVSRKNEEKPSPRYVYGIQGLARLFDCSIPTATRIKRSGKINAAITQIGRKIIVDSELALQLARDAKKKGKWG